MQNKNIIYHQATVTRHRRNKLNEHKSIVIWFTGLSGSGKSTLAHIIEEELHQRKCITFVLDGDNIRHGLSSNLNFSDNDRKENIRRIAECSKIMIEAGVIVMTAFISPFQADRELARSLMPHGDFIEIYCNASLEQCEKRDVKGLYKLARGGKIKNYTGISSTYEPPKLPELIVYTDTETIKQSVAKILNLLKTINIIN